MIARIRKSKIGSYTCTHSHSDTFIPDMYQSERVSVIPIPGRPGWFSHEEYNYHSSWLDFKSIPKSYNSALRARIEKYFPGNDPKDINNFIRSVKRLNGGQF